MSFRGEDGEVVAHAVVEVEFQVRAWNAPDGGARYDWITEIDESEQTYETIEEAAKAARESLGG